MAEAKVLEFRFGIRKTPRGCVAWRKSPRGMQEKQFFDGYAASDISARKCITEWVESLLEHAKTNDRPDPLIVLEESVGVDLETLLKKPTKYPDWLLERTHMVRFNPNCNKQFEVRLVGCGYIDGKELHETRDFVGYGNTLAEAAANAETARKEKSRG